ncbi:hypothetical protein BXZ70DRAFT_962798 [Cristinia sonorae]|uniref:Uncharacterized protein n=1 Tax=Cristinia sonorae TaxID=1940300 RepID=A0A8K0UEI4_9AGAR|nr:hypothetical protein BXZ70DRAFT_962798 [Cristinia sonorae]
MATLPFEQRAQIAQDLHDDSDSLSLKSLSQVSFQWRVPAQMYLFQNLHISIIKQRNARDFLHFLQASPHLLPFVRTLGLYQRGSSYVSVTEITAITSTLPNLRNLELYAYLTIVAGDEGAQEDALTINCGLTLMRVYLNEEAFTMLLAFFRGPQLLVNSVFLTNFTTDTRVSLDLSNYSSLRRVHVGEVAKLGGLDDESVVPIRDILVSICPQTLKAFGMVCDVSYTTDVRLVNKYLGSKGHCVEDLQLDFASDAEAMGRCLWIGIPSGYPSTVRLSKYFRSLLSLWPRCQATTTSLLPLSCIGVLLFEY